MQLKKTENHLSSFVNEDASDVNRASIKGDNQQANWDRKESKDGVTLGIEIKDLDLDPYDDRVIWSDQL